MIEAQRDEDGQVQDADACALQRHRIAWATRAKAKAEREQCDGTERDRGKANPDRDRHPLGGVLEKKRDADEKHDDADSRERVPAAEKAPEPVRLRPLDGNVRGRFEIGGPRSGLRQRG